MNLAQLAGAAEHSSALWHDVARHRGRVGQPCTQQSSEASLNVDPCKTFSQELAFRGEPAGRLLPALQCLLASWFCALGERGWQAALGQEGGDSETTAKNRNNLFCKSPEAITSCIFTESKTKKYWAISSITDLQPSGGPQLASPVRMLPGHCFSASPLGISAGGSCIKTEHNYDHLPSLQKDLQLASEMCRC